VRGPQWYAKFRLPDGRQVQRRLDPVWTERGRPPAGYFSKRLAKDWPRGTLDEARRGTLPGMVRPGATFADACADERIEDITATSVEAFQASPARRVPRGRPITPRTRNKILNVPHGIFARAKKYGRCR